MCVISHSTISGVWGDINACILDSSLAVCVISPRAIRVVLCSIISMCIVKCVHLDVMFVTNHLPFNTIGSTIKSCILMNDHVTVMCVMCCSITWRLWKNVFRHNNEYPYSCSLCGKGFSFRSDLTIPDHVLTGKCPYVYNVCDKSFAQKFALNKQQCVHTGERSYNSDVCSESFRNKITVNAHKVIHTEECPFGYGACCKSFGCRKHLSSHISLCCVKRL